MTPTPATVWPEEIRLSKAKDSLFVKFDNGYETTLTAELLRVESPSAEVQGHGSGQKTTPAGKANVTIAAIEPVGNYAIRISFSDGHDTGLFSWDILHDYGQRQQQLIDDYLARLAAAGQRRD
ncbi:MAG: gamma-butyrobetaine hydroxylase-like domain-containing protein [Candidatus Puniceispirillaceae bacterium]